MLRRIWLLRCAYAIILNFHYSISEVIITVKDFWVGWAELVTELWSIKPAGTQHFRSRLKCVGESFGVCLWATFLLQVSTSAFLPAQNTLLACSMWGSIGQSSVCMLVQRSICVVNLVCRLSVWGMFSSDVWCHLLIFACFCYRFISLRLIYSYHIDYMHKNMLFLQWKSQITFKAASTRWCSFWSYFCKAFFCCFFLQD